MSISSCPLQLRCSAALTLPPGREPVPRPGDLALLPPPPGSSPCHSRSAAARSCCHERGRRPAAARSPRAAGTRTAPPNCLPNGEPQTLVPAAAGLAQRRAEHPPLADIEAPDPLQARLAAGVVLVELHLVRHNTAPSQESALGGSRARSHPAALANQLRPVTDSAWPPVNPVERLVERVPVYFLCAVCLQGIITGHQCS